MNDSESPRESNLLYGHPTGLFTLFFAEMWERFSYYGMRALLIFYIIKGFLGYNDDDAYAVYGAYTALVYATPFIGGMLADRLLGARRAVVLGGLLMAAGHLAMTIENEVAFFAALSMLICGNGFFKPNISTIVGSLYPKGSQLKDRGFTIFYMGINLGATMSPLICGYIGETYGWHYGFGLATIGMLAGLAVFVIPAKITRFVILFTALAAGVSMIRFVEDNAIAQGVNIFTAVALFIAALIAFKALNRGGLPDWAGMAPDEEALKRKVFGFLRADWAVYLGTLLVIPLIALLVQRNEVAGWILNIFGIAAFGYILMSAFRSVKVERERLYVVLVLMFFSMLFWAFFEQAGSSLNNFTDRNVDRVFESDVISTEEVGEDETIELTQEQLGHINGDPEMWVLVEEAIREVEADRGKLTAEEIDELVVGVREHEELTLTALDALRAVEALRDKREREEELEPRETRETVVNWQYVESNVGMGVAASSEEIKASKFQAVNPIYILLFGLVFSWLWGVLGKRGWEPSTPVKFALGVLQLGIGFGIFWYGAQLANDRGMVGIAWLMVGYLLITTGELCLSPVGLSMVTKLSPARLVSTIMGAWFLATAFSNYLAAIIAKFTGVGHGEGGQVVPPPVDTVHVYGDVFGIVGLTAIGSAVLLFLISPILKKWMHNDEEEGGVEEPGVEAV